MEAFKNLIKNIALFLFIGAVPSICWASGLFAAFSWPSFFLILASIFCILWLKARTSSHLLRQLLLTQGEEWAICEGDQIVDHSPYFPADSLSAFKAFLHPDSLVKVQTPLARLFHENLPFQMRVDARGSNTAYMLKGAAFEGKVVLLFNNITDVAYQEHIQLEMMQKNEELLKKLQNTLDSLPVLAWHRDDHQKITYCNFSYATAVQELPKKVCEESIELIHSRAAKTLARKALHTQELHTLESPAIADGERRYFRICEMPDPQGGTLGVAYDMTELNEANVEIKRLIDAHDTVLDHLSTAMAIYDAEGTLQYYNQAYVNLHAFEEEFLKAKPRLDEVLEELRHRRQLPEYADFPAYKKWLLLQLKEQVEPHEDLMHLPDERTLRIFSAPHPLGGLLFMFEDVTDYLALEGKNKTLLDAYQTTLDNLFEGVIVIGSDNRLKIFNPSFVHLWNFAEEDIKPGQHITYIIEKMKDLFEYDDDAWTAFKAKAMETLTDRIPKTGQLSRKDGTVVDFGYVPLPNGDHLLSYTDATDTSLVQQALQEKNEALETADYLKSEFIANVSYELRSPLTTIIGFTEILSRQYFGDLNERQEDYVNGVLDCSNKLLHLVNDILDLASIEAGYLTLQPNSVLIPSLLKDVVKLVSKRADSNHQHLTYKYSKDVQEWIVDERRLKQALFNLLSNAIKFTPPEGKITLEAKTTKNELVISVSDTGVGISHEDQSRIFEKFERGKREPQLGAGLGLSLVKNIIELHGGRIHLSSEVDKGTQVTCILPKRVLEEGPQEEELLEEARA